MVGEGKVSPQGKWYRVGSVNQKGQGSNPVVKIINPTQQAVDRAKQELKRVASEFPDTAIKKKSTRKSVQSRTNLGRGRTAKKPASQRSANKSVKSKANNRKKKPVKRLSRNRNQRWNLSV